MRISDWSSDVCSSDLIAHGASILAAQAMGADLAYIGSAFIATEEANAATGYKDMIVDCSADDIVGTTLFTGVFGNYLRPSVAEIGRASCRESVCQYV